jgi:hypothetical protein
MTRAALIRLVCALAACAAVAAGFALVSSGTRSERATTAGVLIPSVRGEILPFSGGTVHSTNWSGYAVRSKSHKISGVDGTFVVPRAANSGFAAAATWAGIGGFKTKDLIQAGTGEDSLPSVLFGKKYFAWYELLPNSEVPLHGCKGDSHCKVSPGNHMSISISNVSGNKWRISVTNAGHWNWSKTVSYNSSRSSADWILEAPSVGMFGQLPLASVGTVHFGPTSKYTTGGASHTIKQGHPVKIILSGEAKPSALGADGQSFNDCAYRSGTCPRP